MTAIVSSSEVSGVVSMRVGDQSFGAPVLEVEDVITATAITVVPLAPPEVAGSLNLRGRIVTAIDMRARLGMPPRGEGESFMCVIVERASELYALLVDDVGDVLWLPPSSFETPPPTLSSSWRGLIQGLYRLESDLLLIFDVGAVLNLSASPLAA